MVPKLATLRNVKQKYVERFETLCWRVTEMTSRTDRVRKEEVLHKAKEDRNIIHTIRRRNVN
jgi:uncharacterized protein YbbC (DUF1343 family)